MEIAVERERTKSQAETARRLAPLFPAPFNALTPWNVALFPTGYKPVCASSPIKRES